jgi:hypothetical protein
MIGAHPSNHSKEYSTMDRNQLLTIGNLEDFKKDLFEEIKNLIKGTNNQQTKKWLKSSEVRKMLGVSPGTLQNLRINRTITFSKVSGIMFYKYDEIISLLERNSTPQKSQ